MGDLFRCSPHWWPCRWSPCPSSSLSNRPLCLLCHLWTLKRLKLFIQFFCNRNLKEFHCSVLGPAHLQLLGFRWKLLWKTFLIFISFFFLNAGAIHENSKNAKRQIKKTNYLSFPVMWVCSMWETSKMLTCLRVWMDDSEIERSAYWTGIS